MRHQAAAGLIAFGAVLACGLPSRAQQETERRLDEVEDRLDQVEKRAVLDRVSLGIDYRTIVNAFHYSGPSPDPYARVPGDPTRRQRVEQTTPEVWSHRLRVVMTAEPVASVRVSARLVLFKHFGDVDQAAFIQDSQASRVPRDSGARFDQAWIDWFLLDWLSLSVGRMSYTDVNPPGELKENSEIRQPTWGLQMVDGEYETANLTVNLSRLLPGFLIRAFYASWFSDNDATLGGFPFLNSGIESQRLFGVNIDLQLPGLDETYLQIGYFNIPSFRPAAVPIYDPGFDPSSDYTRNPAHPDALLYPSRMPDSLGTYQNISWLVEAVDLLGVGLDLFLAGSIGLTTPSSEGIEYNLPDPADPTRRRSTPTLFLTSESDGGVTLFLFGGVRYTIPLAVLNTPRIGFEVNHGSRYHICFATPNEQLLSKLATRGQAYEAYLTFPINRYLFLRTGYLLIENRYQTGQLGPDPATFGSTAPQVDQRIHNGYLLLNVSI